MTSAILSREAVVVDENQQEFDQPCEQKHMSLKEAMLVLDIRPFNQKAVERYQKKMAWQLTPIKTKVARAAVLAAVLLLLASMVGVTVAVVASMVYLITSTPISMWVIWTVVGSGVGAVFGIATITSILKADERGQLIWARWRSIPRDEYHQPVPEFVCQTAHDLKEKCPEAEFSVEELHLQRRFDPFLAVKDQEGKTYYLEVWNESSFTRGREY